MRSEKMATQSSTLGSLVRKRLSDITNSQFRNSKLVNIEPSISDSTHELINQLLQEKVTLIKLIDDRDKLVALSNNQMRNLRMHYQKLQMQNWSLAQSNSQILAEVNLGREKVKALQHELACKDALLKAKNCGTQGKADINTQNNIASLGKTDINSQNDMASLKDGTKDGEDECLYKADNKTTKHGNNPIRRRKARSQSTGPFTTSRHGVEKEKPENKRRSLRRQSARFKMEEQEPVENLFEIENISLPNQTIISSSSTSKEEQRCSLGRPIRRATEKVQSYKEIPLNIKLRRHE